MIEVVKYTADKKVEWDEFVTKAKNGTFLFYRDFIEYHSEKFEDFSLMIYEKTKLKAIFPANKKGTTIHSHQGLTFGGLITHGITKSYQYIEYHKTLNDFLKANGIIDVYIKSIPEIYKIYCGGEEEYFLHHIGAHTKKCSLASCIDLTTQRIVSQDRKYNLKKAIKNDLQTSLSDKWAIFWQVMLDNMKTKYNAKPVHSITEIKYLRELFPNNILLFESCYNGNVVAGAVIFKYERVAKIQYAHATELGKKLGAIDHLYSYLINLFAKDCDYIDIGTSNETDSDKINIPLLRQKEGFGARAVTYKIFHYNLLSNSIL